jgi:hypothetical protein
MREGLEKVSENVCDGLRFLGVTNMRKEHK